MKKILSMILLVACLFAVACPVLAAEKEEMTPQYVNTNTVRSRMTISDNGLATIALTCSAKSTVTQISVKTHLEKKVGSTWVVVDISEPNDQWVDTVFARTLLKTHTHQLSASGTYRAVAEFTVTAAQTETFTLTSTEVKYAHNP